MTNRRTILTTTALASLLMTSFLMTLATVPETVSAYESHDPIYIEGNAEFTEENGVTGGSGTASDPYIIEGWDIDATTGHGIWIGDTTAHFTIRDCYVHDGGSAYRGIDLVSCSKGTVTGNTCSGNLYGIRLVNSDGNTLSGNNCSSSIYTGIYLSYSSSNTLSGNDCNSNTNGGILLFSSDSNTLGGNNCSGNGYGIEFVYSSSNTLSGSICSSNNEYGICLSSSSDNTLSKNNVSSNGLCGIDLWDSTGTTVYHNIFFDNVVDHAYDKRGSENLWNASYPIGGNYWDNYTGIDEYSGPDQDQPGPDGIGDTPFEIDADSFDYYPLMEPELPNIPPTASFAVSPSTGYVSTVFSVDASSSSDAEDDLSVLEVRWDWESDGDWDTSWTLVKTDTHQYSTEGTHTIALEVRDTLGLVGNTTRQVTVVPDDVPPEADAGPDQTVSVGEEVAFDGSDSSDNIGIVNYTWTFVDGTAKELYGVSPTYTFDIAGTYTVTLTVEDAAGETDTDTVRIVVEEEDGKGFLESYGLPLGIALALVVITLILFFVLRGRKGGKAPTSLEEPPSTEPASQD